MDTKRARIVGEVLYSPGDGKTTAIPEGPCEIVVTDQDATITWIDGDLDGMTSIPLDTYRTYLADGHIALDG